MGGISLHIFLGLSVVHDLSISLWSKSIHRFARIGIGGVGFFSWFQSVTGYEGPGGAFGNFGTAVAEDGGNREEGAFHLGKVWDVKLILINYTPHPRTVVFYCFFALTPWFWLYHVLAYSMTQTVQSEESWRVKWEIGSRGPAKKWSSWCSLLV